MSTYFIFTLYFILYPKIFSLTSLMMPWVWCFVTFKEYRIVGGGRVGGGLDLKLSLFLNVPFKNDESLKRVEATTSRIISDLNHWGDPAELEHLCKRVQPSPAGKNRRRRRSTKEANLSRLKFYSCSLSNYTTLYQCLSVFNMFSKIQVWDLLSQLEEKAISWQSLNTTSENIGNI